MKRYEVMYIVDSSNEDEIDDVKKKIEGIVTGREGTIISFDKMGKKRLAYQIAKRQYGIYFLLNLTGDGRIVQALDYFFRLSPVVIRHIILVFTDKAIQLKLETERIQLEEAERMRQGGKPLNAPTDDDEAVVVKDSDDKAEAAPKKDVAEPKAEVAEAVEEAVVEPVVVPKVLEPEVEEPPVENVDDVNDKTTE